MFCLSVAADSLFRAVANMYYRPRETAPNGEVWVSAEYDKFEYPTLDMLISPLRKPSVLGTYHPQLTVAVAAIDRSITLGLM